MPRVGGGGWAPDLAGHAGHRNTEAVEAHGNRNGRGDNDRALRPGQIRGPGKKDGQRAERDRAIAARCTLPRPGASLTRDAADCRRAQPARRPAAASLPRSARRPPEVEASRRSRTSVGSGIASSAKNSGAAITRVDAGPARKKRIPARTKIGRHPRDVHVRADDPDHIERRPNPSAAMPGMGDEMRMELRDESARRRQASNAATAASATPYDASALDSHSLTSADPVTKYSHPKAMARQGSERPRPRYDLRRRRSAPAMPTRPVPIEYQRSRLRRRRKPLRVDVRWFCPDYAAFERRSGAAERMRPATDRRCQAVGGTPLAAGGCVGLLEVAGGAGEKCLRPAMRPVVRQERRAGRAPADSLRRRPAIHCRQSAPRTEFPRSTRARWP